VDVLSSNILRLLLEAKLQPKLSPLNSNLVADHFYCLLDWIMSSTIYIFDKRALASKVFEAIEIGLLGQKVYLLFHSFIYNIYIHYIYYKFIIHISKYY
jgi:hypothetical protein